LKMSSLCLWHRLPFRYIQPPQRLNTSIQGTAMNMIKARKRSLPSLINFQAVFISCDQANMLIFYNLISITI